MGHAPYVSAPRVHSAMVREVLQPQKAASAPRIFVEYVECEHEERRPDGKAFAWHAREWLE